jgi:uncharacterized protein
MSGIIDLFIPKEKKFLEYIDRQVLLLDSCVKQLNKLSKKGKINLDQLRKVLDQINKKSDESDLVTRETINSLHKTFITPIDREEIKSLVASINHIIDSVKRIANCILYFKIKKLDLHLLKQLDLLNQIVETLKLIFEEPLFLERNRANIDKVKRLEDKADDVFRIALGSLFNNSHDPIEIIKQKEMYEIIEDAIDDAKRIVDILETVLINNL